MLPSVSPLCEGSVRLPLLSSGDSGAFVSVCVRSSSCADLASDPFVISSILPRSLHRGRSSLLQTGEHFFPFFFSEIKHLRTRFAGQHCFISFRLFSSAFSVVDEWTLLYFNFGNDFLKTRMDSLLHCGKEKHNKESFNLQLCDCQHSKRSAAGGDTS